MWRSHMMKVRESQLWRETDVEKSHDEGKRRTMQSTDVTM